MSTYLPTLVSKNSGEEDSKETLKAFLNTILPAKHRIQELHTTNISS